MDTIESKVLLHQLLGDFYLESDGVLKMLPIRNSEPFLGNSYNPVDNENCYTVFDTAMPQSVFASVLSSFLSTTVIKKLNPVPAALQLSCSSMPSTFFLILGQEYVICKINTNQDIERKISECKIDI